MAQHLPTHFQSANSIPLLKFVSDMCVCDVANGMRIYFTGRFTSKFREDSSNWALAYSDSVEPGSLLTHYKEYKAAIAAYGADQRILAFDGFEYKAVCSIAGPQIIAVARCRPGVARTIYIDLYKVLNSAQQHDLLHQRTLEIAQAIDDNFDFNNKITMSEVRGGDLLVGIRETGTMFCFERQRENGEIVLSNIPTRYNFQDDGLALHHFAVKNPASPELIASVRDGDHNVSLLHFDLPPATNRPPPPIAIDQTRLNELRDWQAGAILSVSFNEGEVGGLVFVIDRDNLNVFLKVETESYSLLTGQHFPPLSVSAWTFVKCEVRDSQMIGDLLLFDSEDSCFRSYRVSISGSNYSKTSSGELKISF